MTTLNMAMVDAHAICIIKAYPPACTANCACKQCWVFIRVHIGVGLCIARSVCHGHCEGLLFCRTGNGNRLPRFLFIAVCCSLYFKPNRQGRSRLTNGGVYGYIVLLSVAVRLFGCVGIAVRVSAD